MWVVFVSLDFMIQSAVLEITKIMLHHLKKLLLKTEQDCCELELLSVSNIFRCGLYSPLLLS